MDVHALNWLDLEWSRWQSLDPTDGVLSSVSTDEGLYRIRHPDYPGLVYIGETGRSTRGRLRALAREAYAEEMPFRSPHTAAPCLWAIRDANGPSLEFSATTPPVVRDEQARKGLEAGLIAVHRREIGRSPTANFARIIEGYQQSSYRSKGIRGGPHSAGEVEPHAEPGVGPPEWHRVEDFTDPEWMGLTWSEPSSLGDRLSVSPPTNGLYRIWYEGETPPLAYIGESSNVPSRLYSHEQTFGSDALFATVDRADLDAAHKRKEIETDLIGAHYLEFEQTPTAQFGRTDRLPHNNA